MAIKIAKAEFYSYSNVKDLPSKCEKYKEEVVRCRTVGILQSEHGRFYLYDIDESGLQLQFKVQVSATYLKSPLPSTVVPFPIQVFGMLQWRNRPVVYIKLYQVLNIGMALRIRDLMSTIVSKHLPTNGVDQDCVNAEDFDITL